MYVVNSWILIANSADDPHKYIQINQEVMCERAFCAVSSQHTSWILKEEGRVCTN